MPRLHCPLSVLCSHMGAVTGDQGLIWSSDSALSLVVVTCCQLMCCQTFSKVQSVLFVCGCVVTFYFIYLSHFIFVVSAHSCELGVWREPILSANPHSAIC